jgi:hypothetical protein
MVSRQLGNWRASLHAESRALSVEVTDWKIERNDSPSWKSMLCADEGQRNSPPFEPRDGPPSKPNHGPQALRIPPAWAIAPWPALGNAGTSKNMSITKAQSRSFLMLVTALAEI